MFFYILIGVFLSVMALTIHLNIKHDGYQSGHTVNIVGVALCGLFLGAILFGIVAGIDSSFESGERHVDKVERFAVVEGSDVTIDAGEVSFVTEENGSLRPMEIYANQAKFVGTERKTVEVTHVRWERGTGVAPWGISAQETLIVIR